MDLSVLRNISYGMYAIGVMDGDSPTGCMINTACQITSENPVFSIALNKNNHTHTVLQKTGMFALSILHEQADQAVIAMLGYRSGRDVKKFESIDHVFFHDLPVLAQSCGSIACKVLHSVDMETHVVYFARLLDTMAGTDNNPMTYAYYHAVRRASAPKNAPTFQKENTEFKP